MLLEFGLNLKYSQSSIAIYTKTARKYVKNVHVVFSGDFLFSILYIFAFSQFFRMSLGYFHNPERKSIF